MKNVKLGGLTVGRIGLGMMGMSFAYGGAGSDDAESIRTLHRAIDLGVTMIDTAEAYGPYANEELLGQALRGGHRDRVVIATKFGLISHIGRDGVDSSPANIRHAVEGSLRRLGVDHIDLFQLHWPAPQPIAETARACEALLEAGKIRAIGVSNYSVEQLEEWRTTGVPLHSLQAPYSILRPAAKANVIPWCAAHATGVIAYSPLFRGLLFGTWTAGKTFPPGDARGAHKD